MKEKAVLIERVDGGFVMDTNYPYQSHTLVRPTVDSVIDSLKDFFTDPPISRVFTNKGLEALMLERIKFYDKWIKLWGICILASMFTLGIIIGMLIGSNLPRG